MSHYFNENGSLSEEGKTFLTNFRSGLEMLFDTDELRELTECELRMLQSNMIELISTKFSNRIASKIYKANKFANLTDQEFEDYLKNKYGNMYPFMSLTEEELHRVKPLSEKMILEAIQQGQKEYIDIIDHTVFISPPGYFKE